ncbi:MAG: S8 family serine peptidase [Chitinophagales bacterium]|nr:S8 family serine peptidase [Chitinophagales bacterium]
MNRITLLCLLLFTFANARAQEKVYNKFWVQLADKNNNGYALGQPESFLSQKAIERREHYNIPIEFTDLPLTPTYVQVIANTGATILLKSKWLNAVAIQTLDTSILKQIREMPFVLGIEPVAATTIQSMEGQSMMHQSQAIVKLDDNDVFYGASFPQIDQVNGQYLHQLGYWGEGMQIAVMDAGFERADSISAFDDLRENGRILGTYDFVEGRENVYLVGGHGRNVFSIIAAKLPGEYIGSAPNASYYLFRTEEGGSEYRIEEANWIAAAELADSFGVDMITSSLGYSTFNDSTMNYGYADMDGQTTKITRAADLAARKGILVVNSAGNEGNSDWRYLTAPSDGDSVLCVGAVDINRRKAGFSSFGPSASGRVKPNIAGFGLNTAYIDVNGNVAYGSGTSYSTPLLAGLTACLWQSIRDKSNMEIIDALQQTASQAEHPNDSLGYGIPNFQYAFMKLMADNLLYEIADMPKVYPNPFSSELHLLLYNASPGTASISVGIFDGKGALMTSDEKEVNGEGFGAFHFTGLDNLLPGIYYLRVNNNDRSFGIRAIKL